MQAVSPFYVSPPSPPHPPHPHRLISLSQSPHTSPEVLNNVAALMHNVFEGGGTSEGRKNALSSGVLDLTVKLLTSRDPIPVRHYVIITS